MALAVRCARRAQPLIVYLDNSGRITPLLEQTIQTVEAGVASAARPDQDALFDALQRLKQAERGGDADAAGLAIYHAVGAAYHAAHALYEAPAGAEKVIGSCRAATRDLCVSIAHGAQVFAGDRRTAVALAERAIAADYQRLRRLDLGSYPDLGGPVDSSVDGPLGPLWPEGAPDWYREDTEPGQGAGSALRKLLEELSDDELDALGSAFSRRITGTQAEAVIHRVVAESLHTIDRTLDRMANRSGSG